MKNNNQQHINPEFFKAFDHYKSMVKQYGEEHPIAMQAFMLAFEYSPQWMKDEAYAMAEEYLPKPSGYLDNGEPVYNLQDIAKHHDIPFEQAEQDLLTMMQQREELGLSTDGVLINAHVNRIQ
jgi:arylsulfatase A-like enzyme